MRKPNEDLLDPMGRTSQSSSMERAMLHVEIREEIKTVLINKRIPYPKQDPIQCMRILVAEGEYDRVDRIALDKLLAITEIGKLRRRRDVTEEIRANIMLLPIQKVRLSEDGKPTDPHLRFANHWEFLALGCTQHDLQRHGPILLPLAEVCLSGSSLSRELRKYAAGRIWSWPLDNRCHYPMVLQG